MPYQFPLQAQARFQPADFGKDLWSDKPSPDLLVADPLADCQLERKRLKQDAFEQEFSACLEKALAEEMKDPREKFAPFPIRALPAPLARWVKEQSRALAAPPEILAFAALSVSSAATLRRVAIDGGEGRREPANLFVGLMHDGRPANEKAISAALKPLRDVEFQELDAWNHQLALDKVQRESARREIKQLEKLARQGGDPEELRELDEARARLEAMKPLPAPRRVVDQPDAKSLAVPLAELGHAAIISQRGHVFRDLRGRSSAAREKLFSLLEAGHAGVDYVAELPKGRLAEVAQAAVACCSTIDPELAFEVGRQRQMPARGLLARFLYVAPASRWRKERNGAAVSPEAAAKYQETIRRLAGLEAKVLSLAADAQPLHSAFQAEIEAAIADGGPLAPIRAWGTHLPGAVLRLAGLLHLWTGSEEGEIGRETMAAAIELARWLVPHAAFVFEQFGGADDDCTDDERILLRFARGFKEFSLRDATQHLRKTFTKASILAWAIAGLIRRGYLRGHFVDRGGPGRPRGAQFEIVPRAIGLSAPAPPAPPAQGESATPESASESPASPAESTQNSPSEDPPRHEKKRRRPKR